ncbi:hypothetical protein U1Q18_047424 [Sarracenia purpurea var. burkii]
MSKVEKLLKDVSPLRDLLTTTGSIFLVIDDGGESHGIFLVIGDWFDPNRKYEGLEIGGAEACKCTFERQECGELSFPAVFTRLGIVISDHRIVNLFRWICIHERHLAARECRVYAGAVKAMINSNELISGKMRFAVIHLGWPVYQ